MSLQEISSVRLATKHAIYFAVFFNLILWAIDYGRNPIDDARQQKVLGKLARGLDDQGKAP